MKPRSQKEIALLPRRIAAQPRIPKNRRSDPGGVGSLACTRTSCLFISRSVCQRWLTSGRHGLTSASLSRPKTRCRSVFVLVAFPPPPVYVLDNEAQPKLSGVRYPEANHFLGAPARFYPRGPDESADSSCASLSASAGASVAATLPPVAVLKHRVAAMLADLLAGHGSRENRDGRRTIRRRVWPVKSFF